MSTLSTNVKTSPMFTTETFHNSQVQDLKQGCSQHPKYVGRKTLLPLVLDGQGIFLEGGVPKRAVPATGFLTGPTGPRSHQWKFLKSGNSYASYMEIYGELVHEACIIHSHHFPRTSG